MERKEEEEEEEEKEGWKLGEVVSGGREGVEVSAKCGGRQKSATPRETKLPSSAFFGDIGANWPPCRALPGPACANPPPRSPSLACNSVQTAKSICLAFLFFLPLRSSSNQSR